MQSPDPRIQALFAQRERLKEEIRRNDVILERYAAAHVSGTALTAPRVDALQHYHMSDNAVCGCSVCFDFRNRREELALATRLIPTGHRWSICGCAECRFVGRIQLNYMAASNLRDLMIEMSFHANYHTDHGEQVMRWFETEIAKPIYTVAWCAYELGRRPVEEWITRCERDLSPVVSGQVFGADKGVKYSLETFMASQLGSAHAYMPEPA
jgi:hypothetical protein